MEKFGTFGQLKYERPDFEALKAFYEKLIGKVKNAKTYEAVKICMARGRGIFFPRIYDVHDRQHPPYGGYVR